MKRLKYLIVLVAYTFLSKATTAQKVKDTLVDGQSIKFVQVPSFFLSKKPMINVNSSMDLDSLQLDYLSRTGKKTGDSIFSPQLKLMRENKRKAKKPIRKL